MSILIFDISASGLSRIFQMHAGSFKPQYAALRSGCISLLFAIVHVAQGDVQFKLLKKAGETAENLSGYSYKCITITFSGGGTPTLTWGGYPYLGQGEYP